MDHLPDVLRSVDGPYALAGFALLIVAGVAPRLMQNVLDAKARRVISFSLLALGGLAILGSLVVAANNRPAPAPAPVPVTDVDAATRGSHVVEVQGQGNTVGNGNVVGNGNTIQQAGK